MKNLVLFLIIVLNSAVLQAQDMYLKKKATDYIFHNSSDSRNDYYYASNWYLDSVVKTKNDGNIDLIYRYENDTLRTLDQITHSTEYIYYNDHIELFSHSSNLNYLGLVYYLNDNKEVIRGDYYNPDEVLYSNEEYIWKDGNCETYIRDGITEQKITYQSALFNPHFNQYKYFKIYAQGSNNFYTTLELNGMLYEYVVENTINDYPQEVKIYINGVYSINVTYEYYIINNIGEPAGFPLTVLSTDYYNLLGQQIEKPAKGFYIESKITDRGIFSKKIYIP